MKQEVTEAACAQPSGAQHSPRGPRSLPQPRPCGASGRERAAGSALPGPPPPRRQPPAPLPARAGSGRTLAATPRPSRQVCWSLVFNSTKRCRGDGRRGCALPAYGFWLWDATVNQRRAREAAALRRGRRARAAAAGAGESPEPCGGEEDPAATPAPPGRPCKPQACLLTARNGSGRGCSGQRPRCGGRRGPKGTGRCRRCLR